MCTTGNVMMASTSPTDDVQDPGQASLATMRPTSLGEWHEGILEGIFIFTWAQISFYKQQNPIGKGT